MPNAARESSAQPDILAVYKNFCKRRVGAAIAVITGSFIIALGLAMLSVMIPQYPDPVEPWRAFRIWQEEAIGLRMSLREVTWEVAAALLGIVGLLSLAQVPNYGSGLEDYAHRSVGQAVASIATILLALYGWISLPISGEEWREFRALLSKEYPSGSEELTAVSPFGIFLILAAGGVATLIVGSDAVQRAKSHRVIDWSEEAVTNRVMNANVRLLQSSEGRPPWNFLRTGIALRRGGLMPRVVVGDPTRVMQYGFIRLFLLWPVLVVSFSWAIWNSVWMLVDGNPSGSGALGIWSWFIVAFLLTVGCHFGFRFLVNDTPRPSIIFRVTVGAMSNLIVSFIWLSSVIIGHSGGVAFWGNLGIALFALVVFVGLMSRRLSTVRTCEFDCRVSNRVAKRLERQRSDLNEEQEADAVLGVKSSLEKVISDNAKNAESR